MEDGAKENTALNIQKPLEILVTDEDKHGTDIACMSDFFGIYIEQLSAELSNQVMRGVVEKIPAADVQILGELVHGVDVLLSGKYGYIPDFDSLPNDVTVVCISLQTSSSGKWLLNFSIFHRGKKEKADY